MVEYLMWMLVQSDHCKSLPLKITANIRYLEKPSNVLS